MLQLPEEIYLLAEKLKENNFQAYLVGGAVRDLVMGNAAHDADIATDATPDQLVEIFPKSLTVGAQFGTVIVLNSFFHETTSPPTPQGFEITTFRSDAKYINGRWPEHVSYAKTIQEDLSRRDFTMNAMAIDLQKLGKSLDLPLEQLLIDPYNGKEDIKNKIIRAVGNPYERMQEDGLRSIRACRFAATLDFSIEEKTVQAIKESLDIVKLISYERVHDELMKLMHAKKPSIGIDLMRETGILNIFIPELLEGVNIEQNEYHAHDVYHHLLFSCDIADPRVRIAALLHDIAKPRTKEGPHFYGHENVGSDMAKDILVRLKFSKKFIDRTTKLIKLHMFHYQNDWKDAAVRRFLAKVGEREFLDELFLLRIADTLSNPQSDYDLKNLEAFKERIEQVYDADSALSLKDLAINGNDLISLGITEGKTIGRILHKLLDDVIEDPQLNTKEALILKAQELQVV